MCSSIYCTHKPWSEAVLQAWTSMPRNATGHLLEPVEMYRSVWRDWLKRTPKEFWYEPVVRAYQELDRKRA